MRISDWSSDVCSSDLGTALEGELRARGIEQIVAFGIATDMCVSTSVRVGANLGFDMMVVADACATFDQRAPDGETIGAELLHRVHLTTLNTEFARVTRSEEHASELQSLMRTSYAVFYLQKKT